MDESRTREIARKILIFPQAQSLYARQHFQNIARYKNIKLVF